MTTPWKDCPTCKGTGWVFWNGNATFSMERPTEPPAIIGADGPCPTCAAVEREVAAAVGEVQRELETERGNRKYQTEELEKAEAEVARLTAQGKELRDALVRVMETLEHEPMLDFANVDITTARAWEEAAELLSTPAGSDDPLRRVRAEALREASQGFGLRVRDIFESPPKESYSENDGTWFIGYKVKLISTVAAFVSHWLNGRASAIERGGEGDSNNKEDLT